MSKEFKTYDQQLAILSSRGIDLSPTVKGISKIRLQHVGYYSLINGYKNLFLLPPASPSAEDQYKPGTTIPEIYALYNFDSKLRNIILQSILPIELNVKNLIAYQFSQKYGNDNYLVFSNFDTNKRDATKNITALLSEIQRQIASRTSDPCINHYLSKYGFIPFWVLNNILTLGTISKFFSMMKQSDRQGVAKVFNLTDDVMESALFYLSKVRNFCAHGNRLYCLRNNHPLTDTLFHSLLNIPQINGEYSHGKRDLFAALIAIRPFVSQPEMKTLVKKIQNELNSLRAQIHVISEQDVLDKMGFPQNWKDIANV